MLKSINSYLHHIKDPCPENLDEWKARTVGFSAILRDYLSDLGEASRNCNPFVFRLYFQRDEVYEDLISFLDELSGNGDRKIADKDIEKGIEAFKVFRERWEKQNKGLDLYKVYKQYYEEG